ncbi:MAG: metallophosphatase [Cyanobacteria bacterium]|nr:metallophosphatase [Cyanobacteriota bacterium]
MWAIASGIEGNLRAYEAVLADVPRRSRGVVTVDRLFVLGDVIGWGARSQPAMNDRLIERLVTPRPGELLPEVCLGLWEERCLSLYALGPEAGAADLVERWGAAAVEGLWRSVSRSAVEWMRSLDLAVVELDCLLAHGSAVGVEDCLTPQTPPWLWLDRLGRVQARRLFCGRSGLAFRYDLVEGRGDDRLRTLEGTRSHPMVLQGLWGVGVGTVGRIPGLATYCCYDPGRDRVTWHQVAYDDGPGS